MLEIMCALYCVIKVMETLMMDLGKMMVHGVMAVVPEECKVEE